MSSTPRQQKTNETRQQYLEAARRYCHRMIKHHRSLDPWCHYSHIVAAAMEDTEKRFVDLGTFGVEGDCELNGEDHVDILYLNTGETYESTLVYWKGRLRITSWGDCIESCM